MSRYTGGGFLIRLDEFCLSDNTDMTTHTPARYTALAPYHNGDII